MIFCIILGYDLRTVIEYGDILEKAGFKDVEAYNNSPMFIDILKSEQRFFKSTRESFIKVNYKYIIYCFLKYISLG